MLPSLGLIDAPPYGVLIRVATLVMNTYAASLPVGELTTRRSGPILYVRRQAYDLASVAYGESLPTLVRKEVTNLVWHLVGRAQLTLELCILSLPYVPSPNMTTS